MILIYFIIGIILLIIMRIKYVAYKNMKCIEAGKHGLAMSCAEGKIEDAKFFIEHGIDINYRNEIGNTPFLITAYHSGGIHMMKFLIENGADIFVLNNNQATALIEMINGRNHELEDIKFLVSLGIDINLKDNNDDTALELAKIIYDHRGYPNTKEAIVYLENLNKLTPRFPPS